MITRWPRTHLQIWHWLLSLRGLCFFGVPTQLKPPAPLRWLLCTLQHRVHRITACTGNTPVFHTRASTLSSFTLGRLKFCGSRRSYHFSPVEIQQRQSKDINLATLLVPSPAVDRQLVEYNNVSVFLIINLTLGCKGTCHSRGIHDCVCHV